jgi:hypothetical protein
MSVRTLAGDSGELVLLGFGHPLAPKVLAVAISFMPVGHHSIIPSPSSAARFDGLTAVVTCAAG